MIGWILFALAVALVLWYYLRRPAETRAPGEVRRRQRVHKGHGRWHGVGVFYPVDDLPCEAAMNIAGKRYLAADAPIIPLSACNAASCHCYYRHYGDRRQGDRRAGHVLHEGVMQNLGLTDERRLGIDRRRTTPLSSVMPT